jgi:hypothetical protein
MLSRLFHRKRGFLQVLYYPTATQVEIGFRKKIIIDEHSGRILVDSVLAEEKKKNGKVIF